MFNSCETIAGKQPCDIKVHFAFAFIRMNWTLDPTIPSGIWWQLSRLGRRAHRLGETYQNTVSTALCVLDRSQSLLLVSVAVWYQAAPGGSQRPVWWPEYWTPAAPTADHSLSILYL